MAAEAAEDADTIAEDDDADNADEEDADGDDAVQGAQSSTR